MNLLRLFRRAVAAVVTAAVVLGAGAPGVGVLGSFEAAAGQRAEALPPALLQALDGDRRRARAALVRRRASLATAALRQRAAAAASERFRTRAARIRAVLDAVPVAAPPVLLRTLTQTETMHAHALAVARVALADATAATAATQAEALDADRRLRALRRASTTTDDRDTTLGSWRFGSGGPAVSAASIDAYLASKGSPMAGAGAGFLEAGVEHELDPRLVVAIAGAESYFGVTTCAPHNGWGWGCPTAPFAFASWEAGFATVTAGLRERYVDEGLTTVGEIHLRYAPPDAANDPDDLNYAWADNVARFLVEQGGDPQDIDGVLPGAA